MISGEQPAFLSKNILHSSPHLVLFLSPFNKPEYMTRHVNLFPSTSPSIRPAICINRDHHNLVKSRVLLPPCGKPFSSPASPCKQSVWKASAACALSIINMARLSRVCSPRTGVQTFPQCAGHSSDLSTFYTEN